MPASTSGAACVATGPAGPRPRNFLQQFPLRLIPIVRDAVVVKRVDKAVHYADAKIEKRERIVLIVNHETSTKIPATVIRSTAV